MGSSNERMILLSHHGRRNQTVSRGTPRSRRLIPEPEPAQQQKKKRDKNTNQTRQTRKETEEGYIWKCQYIVSVDGSESFFFPDKLTVRSLTCVFRVDDLFPLYPCVCALWSKYYLRLP